MSNVISTFVAQVDDTRPCGRGVRHRRNHLSMFFFAEKRAAEAYRRGDRKTGRKWMRIAQRAAHHFE